MVRDRVAFKGGVHVQKMEAAVYQNAVDRAAARGPQEFRREAARLAREVALVEEGEAALWALLWDEERLGRSVQIACVESQPIQDKFNVSVPERIPK